MPNIRHAFSSSLADSGDTTIVRPSNWNADHQLDQYLDYPGQANAPSAPASGSLRVYAASTAGRLMLELAAQNGPRYALQPGLFSTNTGIWAPSSGTGITNLNLPVSTTGTVSTPAITLSDGLITSVRRTVITSASTASSGAGNRTNVAVCYGGGAAVSTGSPGGYFLSGTIGTPLLVASSTAGFFGLRNTAGVIAAGTQTSALVNIVGFGFDRGASTWAWYSNDASGTAASTNLVGFGVSASSLHRFSVFCPSATSGSAIYWRAENLQTGAVSSGSASSDIPSAASLLSLHAHASQNGAGSVAIAFTDIILETDY